jgi:hypothetical protein
VDYVVSIEKLYIGTTRQFHTAVPRTAPSSIRACDPTNVVTEALYLIQARVRGSVIDDDDLAVLVSLIQSAVDCFSDVVLSVVTRDNDACKLHEAISLKLLAMQGLRRTYQYRNAELSAPIGKRRSLQIIPKKASNVAAKYVTAKTLVLRVKYITKILART